MHRRSAAGGGPAPAAGTANSGPPRPGNAGRPAPTAAGLPDTATPRGPPRPRRRSPDRPSEPAPHTFRQPGSAGGGIHASRRRCRPVVRDARHVPAAGLWRREPPAACRPASSCSSLSLCCFQRSRSSRSRVTSCSSSLIRASRGSRLRREVLRSLPCRDGRMPCISAQRLQTTGQWTVFLDLTR